MRRTSSSKEEGPRQNRGLLRKEGGRSLGETEAHGGLGKRLRQNRGARWLREGASAEPKLTEKGKGAEAKPKLTEKGKGASAKPKRTVAEKGGTLVKFKNKILR